MDNNGYDPNVGGAGSVPGYDPNAAGSTPGYDPNAAGSTPGYDPNAGYQQPGYGQQPQAPSYSQAPYSPQAPYAQNSYSQAPYTPDPYSGGYNAGYQQPGDQSGKTMAIISLVLSLAAIPIAFMNYLFWISILCEAAAIVLGAIARKKLSPGSGKGMATAGMVIGIVGLSLVVVIVACACLVAASIGSLSYYY
jgi:hypothetical protein